MAILSIPDLQQVISSPDEIKVFLNQQGVFFDQWSCTVDFDDRASQEEILVRAKFLAEHTHSEDEIRFFVDGQGYFWFNLEGAPVFNVLCQKGDLISVPAGTKHWFDAGVSHPFVKAIRIFIDQSGWIPEYTGSGIDQKYL